MAQVAKDVIVTLASTDFVRLIDKRTYDSLNTTAAVQRVEDAKRQLRYVPVKSKQKSSHIHPVSIRMIR